MQHLEVSCAVRRFFKSLGFKGLICYLGQYWIIDCLIGEERGKREAFCTLVHDLTL